METLPIMAIDAHLEIVKPGYVPAANGEIRVTVKPTGRCASAISLPLQGKVGQVRGVAISSHLSERKVSERMADARTNALVPRG